MGDQYEPLAGVDAGAPPPSPAPAHQVAFLPPPAAAQDDNQYEVPKFPPPGANQAPPAPSPLPPAASPMPPSPMPPSPMPPAASPMPPAASPMPPLEAQSPAVSSERKKKPFEKEQGQGDNPESTNLQSNAVTNQQPTMNQTLVQNNSGQKEGDPEGIKKKSKSKSDKKPRRKRYSVGQCAVILTYSMIFVLLGLLLTLSYIYLLVNKSLEKKVKKMILGFIFDAVAKQLDNLDTQNFGQ